MRIYHYTNIETLALILKNKTIRFSRLDTVDDPDEYSFEADGHNPAKYTFVSCWTRNEKESIPQWLIYGNHRHGVRISIEEDVFGKKQIYSHKAWFTEDELEDKDYIVPPILHDQILFDIVYVKDPQSFYKTNISVDMNGAPAFDMKEVGFYKSKDWEFQQECRFKLYLFPKGLHGKIIHPSILIENNIYPKEKYIDIPINESAYNSIEITLGPDTTLAERIIVESLSKEYLGSIKVKESNIIR